MNTPPYITEDFIEQHTDFAELVAMLKMGFAAGRITVPQRHHHEVPNGEHSATLLLMPAWEAGVDMGVKLVTVHPENAQLNLPTIQGTYVYQDARNGQLKATLDAKALTTKRTAAASALASTLLSRPDSSSLLQIGTGALAPNLILAHAAVRPIEQVYVWGRHLEKAKVVCEQLQQYAFDIQAVVSLDEIIPRVDIISCATLSHTPLVTGTLLQAGQHLDLVGSFKPEMREADDDCCRRSSIFVDVYDGAMQESGDLKIPLAQNVISAAAILADLQELCCGKHPGRRSVEEITMFKSVGYGLEDLVGARYYFKKYEETNNKR